jgi:hypothetical protein
VVRVLSFHAPWRCQHTGRCCSSNWPIPVTPDEATTLTTAIDAHRLTPLPDDAAAMDLDAEGPILLGRRQGRCVSHDRHPAGGCRIQRTLGHQALPLACRQFPRLSVRHGDDVSVTLSHYCPSVRALLNAPADTVSIVDGAPAFPAVGEYVGLNADPLVPPLLHARVALDWDTWPLIESRAVALLDEQGWAGLTRLGDAIERLRVWTPGRSPLHDAVHAAFDMALLEQAPGWSRYAGSTDLTADVMAAIPEAWQATARAAIASGAAAPDLSDATVGRFLAAHAFANWAAYNGRGLRTWYRAIETAAGLLSQTGDPGVVDLLLRHLADPSALIARWNRAEAGPVIRQP